MWLYKLFEYLMKCRIRIGIEGFHLRCLTLMDILFVLNVFVVLMLYTAFVILITQKWMNYNSPQDSKRNKNAGDSPVDTNDV